MQVTEIKEQESIKKFLDIINRYGEVELRDITIDVEELELSVNTGAQASNPMVLREELGRALAEVGRMLLGSPIPVQTPTQSQQQIIEKPKPKITDLIEVGYTPTKLEYTGRIVEVTIGATKADGGSRSKTITIGGEQIPAFNLYEGKQSHPPIVAGDVFDITPPLPKPVRECFGDALNDPLEWAKFWVKNVDVDVIDLELTSSDPYVKDTPIKESVKLVEDMLQAVDVPLMIGGSGNPEKDAKLLPKVAEVCAGERVLLSSATEDMWEPVAKAAQKYNQLILAWTSIDLNQAKELNRRLLEYIPLEQIVIDPTSAALGYGLEYAFTIMERIRLAAIMGDEELQCPQGSGTANSWGAREAWRKAPELGPREYRGPLWETTAAITYLLAGIDLFIMLHPGAVRTFKDLVGWLMGEKNRPTFTDWIGIGA